MNVDAMPAAGPEPAFVAFIGLDWADRKRDWMLQPATPGEGGARAGQFAQTPEAVEAWVAELRAHYGERPIAVALEQSRGALLYQLMKYPNLVLFPVHPNTVAQYRRGSGPRAPRAMPSIAPCSWICWCATATACGPFIRTLPRHANFSS